MKKLLLSVSLVAFMGYESHWALASEVKEECLALASQKHVVNPSYNDNESLQEARSLLRVGERDKAVEGLLTIVRNERMNAIVRLNAATDLFALGEPHKEDIANALLTSAQDSELDAQRRWEATECLSKLGEDYKEKQAKAYLAVARSVELPIMMRFNALFFLASFEKTDKDEASEICAKIALDKKLCFSHRSIALRRLSELDDIHKSKIARSLMNIAHDKELNFDDRLSAAGKLFRLGDSYKEAAEVAFLSIAQDGMLKDGDRIKALKKLNLSTISRTHKDEVIKTCLAIIINHATKSVLDCLKAAELILEEMDCQQKEQVADVFLSMIAKEYNSISKDDFTTIFKFAQKLGAIHERQFEEAYLRIAQNKNFLPPHRLSIASLLLNNGCDRAPYAFCSIACDKEIDPESRFKAATALQDHPHKPYVMAACISIMYLPSRGTRQNKKYYKDQATKLLTKVLENVFHLEVHQLYLSIAKNERYDIGIRWGATNELLERDETYQDEIDQLLFNMINDNRYFIEDRLSYCASPLLVANAFKQQIKSLLAKWLEDENDDTRKAAANFIIDNAEISQEEPLFRNALEIRESYESPQDPGTPINIHKKLKEKIKQETILKSLPYRLPDGKEVSFHPSVFAPLASPQDLPPASYEEFVELVKALFIETKASPIAKEQFNSISREYSQKIVLDQIQDPFFKNLFKETDIKREGLTNPLVVKMRTFMEATRQLPAQGVAGQLSSRSLQLLSLLVNIMTCPAGKADGIDLAFNQLKGETVAKKEDLGNERLKEQFQAWIEKESRAFKESILNGEGKLMQELTGEETVHEPSHQRNYILSLIGGAIGLHYEDQIISFDIHGRIINPQLRNLSRQEALDAFLRYYTPEAEIKHFTRLINERAEEEKKHNNMLKIGNSTILQLYQILDYSSQYFVTEEDQDSISIPLAIKEEGVVELFLRLGRLVRTEAQPMAFKS